MFWSKLRKKFVRVKVVPSIGASNDWHEGFKAGWESALDFREMYSDTLWEELYGKYRRIWRKETSKEGGA